MSIQLFSHPGFIGASTMVRGDIPNLQTNQVSYSTSSIRLSESTDRAIFFTEPDFKGEAMFRTGPMDISMLNAPQLGGKSGFDNNIKSVRISPFDLQVHYIVVHEGKDLPGKFDDNVNFARGLTNILGLIDEVHGNLQEIYNPFLINPVRIPQISNFNSQEYFDAAVDTPNGVDEIADMYNDASFPWRYDALNIVLVNSIGIGVGVYASLDGPRNLLVIWAKVRANDNRFKMARTIGHELGHALGLDDPNHYGNSDPSSLMTQSAFVEEPLRDTVNLSVEQIEIVHEKLALSEDVINNDRIRT